MYLSFIIILCNLYLCHLQRLMILWIQQCFNMDYWGGGEFKTQQSNLECRILFHKKGPFFPILLSCWLLIQAEMLGNKKKNLFFLRLITFIMVQKSNSNKFYLVYSVGIETQKRLTQWLSPISKSLEKALKKKR